MLHEIQLNWPRLKCGKAKSQNIEHGTEEKTRKLKVSSEKRARKERKDELNSWKMRRGDEGVGKLHNSARRIMNPRTFELVQKLRKFYKSYSNFLETLFKFHSN